MEKTMDETDRELSDLAGRVRAAQRRNLLVKLASVVVVLAGIVIGFILRSAYPVDWRGAPWLGFFVGIVIGGALLKRFEVQVEEIE